MTKESMYIPFSLPDITAAEKKAVIEVIDSNWLTTGPKTKEFEKSFAAYINAKHAVALNSCTAALHLALEAIGLREGSEVIVPTLTFAASAEVVRYFKARPVLVDVLAADHQIDPVGFERAITPKTKAVITVHFGGQPCDLDPIVEISRKHGIKVIEDAAHSFPASYKGRPIGSIGDITCFSFYATKPLTTGEGGMATTDNDAWAERMRIMSLHGISKDAWKRYSAEGSWYYEIVAPGYKYNLTDIASALGLVQLLRTNEMFNKRKHIAACYTEVFKNHPSISLPVVHADRKHAWHLFVIRLNLETLTIHRARFIEELKERGIIVSVHFIPLHVHPYYRETYGYQPENFPVAIELYRRSISLPIFSKMTEQQIERVIESVLDVTKKYAR